MYSPTTWVPWLDEAGLPDGLPFQLSPFRGPAGDESQILNRRYAVDPSRADHVDCGAHAGASPGLRCAGAAGVTE
jgi:hypothetical protein